MRLTKHLGSRQLRLKEACFEAILNEGASRLLYLWRCFLNDLLQLTYTPSARPQYHEYKDRQDTDVQFFFVCTSSNSGKAKPHNSYIVEDSIFNINKSPNTYQPHASDQAQAPTHTGSPTSISISISLTNIVCTNQTHGAKSALPRNFLYVTKACLYTLCHLKCWHQLGSPPASVPASGCGS